MLAYLVGLFLWGMAEGTFFFVISEVGLAAAVMRVPLRWWQLTAETLVGILAGSVVTYQAASSAYAARFEAILTKLPGHPPALLARIRRDLLERGWGALAIAHLSPRPFKLYAFASGESDRSLLALITSGVVARGLRLAALAFVVSKVSMKWRLWARPSIGLKTLVVGLVLAALYIAWVEWTYRRGTPGEEALPAETPEAAAGEAAGAESKGPSSGSGTATAADATPADAPPDGSSPPTA